MAIGADVEPHGWQLVCDQPNTADTSGGTGADWDDPAGNVNGNQHYLRINPLISSVRYTLYYEKADTAPTDPVITVYGKHSDDTWYPLLNSSGTHQITITVDVTNDIVDSVPVTDMRRTDYVEVLTKGASTLLATIKTAYAATGNPANALLHALPMIKYQIL